METTHYIVLAAIVLLFFYFVTNREKYDTAATKKQIFDLAQEFSSDNKINFFGTPDYNYNVWKAKYLSQCQAYTPPKKSDAEYENGYSDLVMTSNTLHSLKQEQGLHYAFGQCVENGNRVCNCPDSSFTFVEDMSKVIKDGPKVPGCIQLGESPYCYSIDGENFLPDYHRLSTTSA